MERSPSIAGLYTNPVAQALLNYIHFRAERTWEFLPPFNYQILVPIPSSANGWTPRRSNHHRSSRSMLVIVGKFSENNLGGNGSQRITRPMWWPTIRIGVSSGFLIIWHSPACGLTNFCIGLTVSKENDTFPIQQQRNQSPLPL